MFLDFNIEQKCEFMNWIFVCVYSSYYYY